MANEFSKITKIEYDPAEQTDPGQFVAEPEQPKTTMDYVPEEESRASIIIDEFSKTLEFLKFVEELLDEQLKDVNVEINPDDDPEVWMAMQRIFENPDRQINYSSYKDIVAALEQITEIEAKEADPGLVVEDSIFKEIEDLQNINIETDIENADSVTAITDLENALNSDPEADDNQVNKERQKRLTKQELLDTLTQEIK